MKIRIHAGVADTKQAIADAQRVRNQVFIEEKGLLRRPAVRGDDRATEGSDREMDDYDREPTTRQFIVYVGGVPAATGRLIRPSEAIARALHQPIGLDLAMRYDLSAFVTAGVSFAEVSRICVVPRYRRTGVRCELFRAMCLESLRAGISHWVGAANTETDVLEDAEIAYRIAERDGLVSPRWRVVPRLEVSGSGPVKHPFYNEEQRARARAGDLRGLVLPSTLAVFGRFAARYMGPPLREPGYTVCSLPLVVDLAQAVRTRSFQSAADGP